MPPAPLITLRDVAKSFGGRPVFEGLSFTLAAGDHVGLVGPNGSGKSTLLRIVAGSEEPDAGERIARKGTRIGYVPQDPVFAPGKTVEDVVAEALASAGPVSLESFTDYAAAHRDRRYLRPLIARMSSDNQYVLAAAATALLAYHDDDLTRLVAHARAANHDLDELLRTPRP